MNNSSINLNTDTTPRPKQGQVTSSLKLLVFGMESLNLALPIESVYKVVNRTSIYGSGLKPVGVAHLGNAEVTVVDLYQRFFTHSQSKESHRGGYLVTVKNATGELYGIPVSDTPVLMDVPVSQIRSLPESYRRADTLDVASHVAVIPQQDASPLTLFLLDVDLLLPLFQQLAIVPSNL